MWIEEKLIELCDEAMSKGIVPVSCLVIKDDKLISYAFNDTKSLKHAELIAMEKAMNILNSNTLHDCEIHVSLEPCPMCTYAMVLSRVKKVYFYTLDEKAGAIISHQNILESYNYKPKWEYKPNKIFGDFLKVFFKNKRVKI